VLAAHESAPLVLRDLAPRVPKKVPLGTLRGSREPEGLKIFALKRPFEANKHNAAGHFGHHKNKPSCIKTSSVPAAPQISKHHVP
jgi:hypothetical protein